MLNNFIKLSLFLVSAIVLLWGCKKDPVTPENKFIRGCFILNEGPFQTGTGTITFRNSDTDEVLQDIYGAANGNAALGNIVQSMLVAGDKAFVVVNNANKIVVVEDSTFKKVTEITGFELPRYILKISDDEALVTEWGASGGNGSLKLLDLNTYQVKKTITAGKGPERMVMVGDSVFIANSGGLGRDSTVMIYKLSTQEIISTIVVGDNPVSVQADDSGDVWTLCRGYTDWNNPANSTPGRLSVVRNQGVIYQLEVPNGSTNLVYDNSKDALYFTDGTTIYRRYEYELAAEPLFAFITGGSYYALGVESGTGRIFTSDPKDYSSKGDINIYSNQGVLEETFQAGVIPGCFYFR
jgi:hypothetical protein